MPADSTRLDQEGVVIAPTRADDDVLRELADRMRNPSERLADLRAQRAANLTGARRVAELVERLGADGLARRDGRDPRLRRAPHPRGDRRARPTATYEAERRARGRGRRLAATSRCGCGRRSTATRCGSTSPAPSRPGRGQPQLPALGDQVGGLLRRPRAHRPRRAALGRRPPAGRGGRARGLAAQRAPAGRGRRRQRRDLEPGRRPGHLARSPTPRRRPRRARGR